MKKIDLQKTIEAFASQQSVIVNAEASYTECDPYANID